MGRPTKYNRVIASRICERIATTELGMEQVLAEIKKQDGSAPNAVTIWRWQEAHEEFRKESARARRMQAELLHDRAQLAAQQPLIGEITETVEGPKGSETRVRVADNVERSKLIVQTLLKRAGQLDAKKYGDKLQAEMSGEGGGPIQMSIAVRFIEPLPTGNKE
jgi:alanyl-tRNA synthetase